MPNQQDKQSDDGWVEELLTDIVKFGWTFRTELSLLAMPAILWMLVSSYVGGLFASVAVVVVVSVLLATRRTRGWITRALYKARMRRRWAQACVDVELKAGSGQRPLVKKAQKLPSGDQLLVQVPRGGSVSDIENRAERIAATLGVREVRVKRHESNAAFATVVIVKDDPFEHGTIRWPFRDFQQASLWGPIPIGVDENGGCNYIRLPERNILIGGEPGSGKSAALSMLVATAALDPTVKLWLLDGKLVELAAWSPIAEQTVGPEIDEAIQLLRSLRKEMDNRYKHLLANGLRKVSEGDDFPLHVVVCDELAFYLTVSDRKKRTEFGDLMRDLVSRGRAAGIIVIAATQKPSGDIIPTSLRDLFGFRWAMRCNTPQASDTILGTGWATQGYDSSKIPGSQRGVGYLHTEGKEPLRIKSCYITDHQLLKLSIRAQKMRELHAYRQEKANERS